jgi:tRNA-5-methyluridine54 2-sulfurtransferase
LPEASAGSFMKCGKCGALAVINMPQHRLKLCAEHYLEWVPSMVQRAIEKYRMFTRDERVLVAVSGGKDSLTLWDILIRLGYHTEALYINLGIMAEDYSDVSQQRVESFAAQNGNLALHVVNVRETYGQAIPDIARTRRARGGRHICSACGLVKRHIMNQMARDGGYAAIATGHNVDDEAAVLVQNTLHWQSSYLRRQAPVLPEAHHGLARKVKPLCHLYERETAAYAFVRGIEFAELECPYAVGAKTLFYKELLNQLEHRSAGTKLSFYTSFLQAKEEGLFSAEEAEEVTFGACRRCGQPTTAGDLCAFCRLWEALG